MKKVIGALLIFTLMAFASQAMAGRFWSDDKATNTAIISANTLFIIDWAQTQYGSDRPDQFEESGFARHFTGDHPSTREVNTYNASAMLLMNVMGYFLTEHHTLFGMEWNPKKSLYFGVTAVEGVTVYNNYQAGVKLDF